MSNIGALGSLTDHEEVFRLVFEAAPNGIVVVNDQGLVVLVNRQAELMFGYTRDEFIGLRIDELVPQRMRGSHAKHRAAFAQDAHGRAMGAGQELRGRRRDGSEFPVEIGLTPVHSPEGLLVVSSVVDTTERTRIEHELRRYAEDLERSNAELRNFAHVASHDLQEPLRKITAFGERLRKHCGEVLDPKGNDYLQRMTDASQRMQGLITDLLTFSRVSMHAAPAHSVDLQEVLRTVIDDLEISITETGASLIELKGVPAPLRAAFAFALIEQTARKMGVPVAPSEVRGHVVRVSDEGAAGAEAVVRALIAEREQTEREMRELRARVTAAQNHADLEAARQARVDERRRRGDDAEARAEAALDKAGADLESTRRTGPQQLEVVFAFMGERFVSIVDQDTLRVLDSGICLGHPPADELVTLDSLPGVIREAIETHRLVILREP
jgi:PAS domain S-box-containing protein